MTEGLNEKIYRNMIHVVLNDLNSNEEWHSDSFLNANKFNSFKKTMINLHNPLTKKDIKSNDYRRLVYDEIFSNLIYLSTSRKIIRTKKKTKVLNKRNISNIVLKNFGYKLTEGQANILNEIENDMRSNKRMFRLLQGDVGSGKTFYL